MKQHYDQYTLEDHTIWNILFDRQIQNLQGKSCQAYLDCVDRLSPEMAPSQVPDFGPLERRLQAETGWRIEVVKGLIPVEDFFQLLAEKRFCSSTWLRSREQLDYLEEPDMFHDTFGHIPLLIDPTYAAFMERFGQIGVNHLNDPAMLTALQRLYWFTVEFGLMKGEAHTEIYGAGILSSFGESNHIYNDPIEVLPYDIEAVIHNHFVNSEIQMRYYEISTFEDLYHSLDRLEAIAKEGLDLEARIVR